MVLEKLDSPMWKRKWILISRHVQNVSKKQAGAFKLPEEDMGEEALQDLGIVGV